MKILIVFAHPRSDSLTRQAAEVFAEAARENGHAVEIADLAAERFDPVLHSDDEPQWDNPNKVYSEEVRREMARIERSDATVMIFPVWWWSMPAILKGWVDRVWNNGWAYGDRTYPHKRVLMIAIAGSSTESYKKYGYDKAMHTQLVTGILDYCGVQEGRLAVLHGAIEGGDAPQQILNETRALGASF